MTKDLSRQLCELAGIEAKYSYKPTGQLYTAVELKDEVFHLGFCKDDYEKVYPNFETPDNFVKLLECYFKVIDGVINYHKREEFIAYIIELLEGNDKLKQALQAESWVY